MVQWILCPQPCSFTNVSLFHIHGMVGYIHIAIITPSHFNIGYYHADSAESKQCQYWQVFLYGQNIILTNRPPVPTLISTSHPLIPIQFHFSSLILSISQTCVHTSKNKTKEYTLACKLCLITLQYARNLEQLPDKQEDCPTLHRHTPNKVTMLSIIHE